MFVRTQLIVRLKTVLCALALSGAVAAPALALDLRSGDAPPACGSHTPQIQVVVNGVTPGGILTVELYRPSENAFLRKASREKRVRVRAGSGSQTVCLNVRAPGQYALAAYNDMNGNRKLDRQINMLPTEPFALSSNRPLRLQMPKFRDAAFQVPAGGAKVTLQLQSR